MRPRSCRKICAARKPGLYRRLGLACGLDVVRVKAEEADTLTINFIVDFIRLLGLNQGLRGQRFFRLLFLLPLMLSPVSVSFIVGIRRVLRVGM
jgi:hypothetical protein